LAPNEYNGIMSGSADQIVIIIRRSGVQIPDSPPYLVLLMPSI